MKFNGDKNIRLAITVEWTGLLDWTTGCMENPINEQICKSKTPDYIHASCTIHVKAKSDHVSLCHTISVSGHME